MVEWISVKDELPEPGQNVLRYGPVEQRQVYQISRGVPELVKFDVGQLVADDGCLWATRPVSHWMRLPEPPNAESFVDFIGETPQSEPHDWDDSFGRTPEKKMSREELYGQDES